MVVRSSVSRSSSMLVLRLTGLKGRANSGSSASFSNASPRHRRRQARPVPARIVFSKTSGETVGTADLANDHGFSTWLGAHAGSKIDFEAGYTRSAGYDLNTVFFGVGFRVGH